MAGIDHSLLGVVGNPILFSKSPDIFNYLFEKNKMPYRYTRLAAETQQEIGEFLNQLPLLGINITHPFKEEVVPLCQQLSAEAAILDKVNTMVRQIDNTFWGANTDIFGVEETLKAHHLEISGKEALILGAGGAAESAVFTIHKLGGAPLIANRTLSKAQQLAQRFHGRAIKLDEIKQILPTISLIINTLPGKCSLFPAEWLCDKHLLFNASYQSSPFSDTAQARGCRIIDGRIWLCAQAQKGFNIFFPNTDIPPLQEFMLGFDQADRIREQKKQIALIGFMGAGKSVCGRLLSSRLNLPFVDLDTAIENTAGRTIEQIFQLNGETYFREIEHQLLAEQLNGVSKVIACGGGICQNEKNRQLLQAKCRVIWLWAPFNLLQKRIQEDSSLVRPLARQPELKLKALYHDRLENYAHSADLIISSGIRQPENIMEHLYAELSTLF